MNNLLVIPILVPLLAAMAMVFLRRRIYAQRAAGAAALLVSAAAALVLAEQAARNGMQTLQLGGWPAPFGITLAGDMLAALLVLTANIAGLACLLYVFGSIGREREAHYAHPFLMILFCGVNGSFLTGDIFNLFVFFEVMLIASYALLSLGGRPGQLRESLKYVLVNMVSSTLFVAALAYLYASAGTLNMAHLSERIAAVGQDGPLTAVSLLFLVVFSLKAALFLFFWLPGAYGAPPPAVAAVFAALLTKVGVYAILRVFTLIFYHQPHITHTALIGMGAATMLLGALGAAAQDRIRPILAYNVVFSVGFAVFGIGVGG